MTAWKTKRQKLRKRENAKRGRHQEHIPERPKRDHVEGHRSAYT